MKKAFSSLALLGLSLISTTNAVELQAILIESPEAIQRGKNFKGVAIQDLKLPTKERVLSDRLKPFLGQEISTEMLLQIKSEIVSYYVEHRQPYLLVEIPEQDVTNGRVKYIVLHGAIGKIQFVGNRWFSDKLLGKYLRVQSQDMVDEYQLLKDIASLNRNPFHHSQLILEPGGKPGETNIEILTEDKFPLRIFGGADNTGNPFTGNSRYFAGFNWGNAFFVNDVLTYQFTTADNYKKFWSHFGSYTSLLRNGHTCFLYGGYSEIHPHIRHFKSEGKSYQGSLRYIVPTGPSHTNLSQEFSFGLDVKGMNSSLFFSDLTGPIPVSTHLANLSQLVLAYGLQHKSSHDELSLNLELFGSPAKSIANQNKQRFNEIRPHALPQYIYARLFLGNIWTLPMKFALATNLRLQGTHNPLMPSEQFGLGGYNTVRGYAEHAFNADTALCANLELRMPPIKVFPQKSALTFLAFIDYGLGHNFKNDFHEVPSTEFLIGAGPGVRYEIYPYLSLRADYGFKFHKFVNSGPGEGKFHFSATASY
ncbi:MAG: ShlB/FhaC/HecB family hemolysin secretion/activation protein [Verrucomicrobia bacterium]|nr:ShlB/FhaC/HecB family hemolysin secretion/activation protein [Verrucomicrobiota bacterium]